MAVGSNSTGLVLEWVILGVSNLLPTSSLEQELPFSWQSVIDPHFLALKVTILPLIFSTSLGLLRRVFVQ